MRPFALAAAVCALASCKDGASYVEVTVDSGAMLTVHSLDVKVTNAGSTVDLAVATGKSFTIPPSQTFSIEFKKDRTGDVTVDVRALGDNATIELARASGQTTIVPGGTAQLTVNLTPTVGGPDLAMAGGDAAVPPDLAQPADLVELPDLACGACKVGQVCMAGVCQENHVTCATQGINCPQGGCFQNNRYSISAGGKIVVDLANNRRLWTRHERGPATYNTALNDCAVLLLEGLNQWRLPHYAELQPLQFMTGGLMGCPSCNPAIDQSAFTDATNGDHWTQDYDANKAGFDTPNFCDGRNNYYDPANSMDVYFCTHDPGP